MENIRDEIAQAVEILNQGGIILYPTDTVWGIGCDATNAHAVAKILALKNSSDTKSMLVLVDHHNTLARYVEEVPPLAWDLIELSTKPITIIYPNAKGLAANLVAPDGSIGIRITEHLFSQRLIQTFRKPIVSTSANLSGRAAPKRFHEIDSAIVQGVDYTVAQQYEEGATFAPSSIIKLGLGGQIKIIRE